MSELILLNHLGDERKIWGRKEADAFRKAKDKFDELKAKGWFAYRVIPDKIRGDKKEEIKEFDPEAEKIVMSPAHAGG